MTVYRLDDYRPFDIGTPTRCWKCGTAENVAKCGGDGGYAWTCDHCPHPSEA